MSKRMPTAFIPHAGGPLGHVEFGVSPAEVQSFVSYWRSLPQLSATMPKAVLVISAHWEAKVATVMSAPKPPMFYDYHGFPAEAYQISWPVQGDPALAARIRVLLAAAGFETAEDSERGFDHGTFVPLKLAFPADVPVLQLSLLASLDAAEHLRLGRALAPLRDEGVLIIGSGDSFHNLRGFRAEFREYAEQFNAWLSDALASPPQERAEKLTQ